MEPIIYKFDEHGDHRGTLISIEENKTVPFDIKRVYYMFGTKEGVRRGYHAHKCLKQILICVSGSCKVLLDNGKETAVAVLDSPSKGLYLESDMWREMFDFSSDAVLMVLASELYDESDYIRNYQDFIKYMESKNEH